MNKLKTTRSNKKADSSDAPIKPKIVPALRKIFFFEKKLLQNDVPELKLERFFHPGKGVVTLFITSPQNIIMEVLEHTEPRRSWLINNSVCSNGRIYMTTPVDSTFLALHQLRKHCAQKALALDSIHDENDSGVQRLMTTFVSSGQLRCVADEKSAGDLLFYKYNAGKALAWLALKTRRIAAALKSSGVYCGYSALSQNYAKSEVEQTLDESDLLRAACEIVGSYIDLELHDELASYLAIPSIKENKEAAATVGKRKSLKPLNESKNKKIKLNDNVNAGDQLKNNSLLNESLNATTENSVEVVKLLPTPFKERTFTAKEKALAKGAKGTKSISSFFKK